MQNSFQIEAHRLLRMLASDLRLDAYPLTKSGNGIEYKNFLNRTILTVYHGRLDKANESGIEVAIGVGNISDEYKISTPKITSWIDDVVSTVGNPAKQKPPLQWPRIGLRNENDVRTFVSEFSAFLSSESSHTNQNSAATATSPPKVDEEVIRSILSRRGQVEFRRQLLQAYDETCAITGCKDTEALEAAHIIPHSEEQSYSVSNGLLLRADIHTLFDLFLISVNPMTGVVAVSNSLGTCYKQFNNTKVLLPSKPQDYPDATALLKHYNSMRTIESQTE